MIPPELDLYIGSYTREHAYAPKACGAGILACRFDPRTGELEPRQTLGGVLNPSYLALDRTGTLVIAASENAEGEGEVWVFSRQSDGRLVPQGAQPSGGLATCHVCATPGDKVCASSYLDGVLAVYPLHRGILGVREALYRYVGKSVNAARQQSAHAHQAVVSPDGRWLYVCDLGADRIWCHPLRHGGIAPAGPDAAATPAGSGPRHLAFHPTLPRAYVIAELTGHVLTYEWKAGDGRLVLVDDRPSLPREWTGVPYAAAIRVHPAGTALYVSNRNHDSLTAFRLDDQGRAEWAGCLPTGGRTPRDLAVDPTGRWLLVANQESNDVAVRALDASSGLPGGGSPALTAVATPTCLLIAGTLA